MTEEMGQQGPRLSTATEKIMGWDEQFCAL